jgi:hypothetical protein
MVPKLVRPAAVMAIQVAAAAASDAAPDSRTKSTIGRGARFECEIGKALEITAGVSDQTEDDETHGSGGVEKSCKTEALLLIDEIVVMVDGLLL